VKRSGRGLGAISREKSFGLRLRLGARGGKSLPLEPRTILLFSLELRIDLPISRMRLFFDTISQAKKNLSTPTLLPLLKRPFKQIFSNKLKKRRNWQENLYLKRLDISLLLAKYYAKTVSKQNSLLTGK
jgi:hypothetical protein